jgi:hypothetical protein
MTRIAVVKFSVSRMQSGQVWHWIQLARVVPNKDQTCFRVVGMLGPEMNLILLRRGCGD